MLIRKKLKVKKELQERQNRINKKTKGMHNT